MKQSEAPPTERLDRELSRPAEAGTDVPPVPPPGTTAAAKPSRWTAGRVAALAIGIVLVLLSLGLFGGGGTALWAYLTQRDGGYVTTGTHEFSTSGSALATERIDLGSAGTGWLYSPGLLGTVRIRVTPVTPGAPLFVGIGLSADVDRYLAGVDRTVITEFWDEKVQDVGGGAPGSAPGTQDFWVASAAGLETQTVEWDPVDGAWTVVVMHADGSPGLDVESDLGARMSALPWVTLGVLVGGAILLAGGALLIAGAVRRPDAVRTA